MPKPSFSEEALKKIVETKDEVSLQLARSIMKVMKEMEESLTATGKNVQSLRENVYGQFLKQIGFRGVGEIKTEGATQKISPTPAPTLPGVSPGATPSATQGPSGKR